MTVYYTPIQGGAQQVLSNVAAMSVDDNALTILQRTGTQTATQTFNIWYSVRVDK